MVMFSNYLPENQKMEIKEFKFFHGISLESEGIQGIIRTLRRRLEQEREEELTRILTENWNQIIDELNEEN
jgi:hypothetical protein